ncbi:unnamed protein product [Dibothriocephalus latus]|uniref:Uncharacterized protein n=1 Tax=Dibothriocephalus latus TaxID=60516 RepID=A0A3P7N962_DIBLA|nr:unnamed protein product [Dibothriocephalus latus]
MNSLLLGASPNSQGSTNSRQQLIQQAIQYNLLLQQQQQQAAAAQQAQQAAAAAAQQAQQNALLQLVNALQSNPAAYLTLLQNIWLMGAATNPAGGLGSANKNASVDPPMGVTGILWKESQPCDGLPYTKRKMLVGKTVELDCLRLIISRVEGRDFFDRVRFFTGLEDFL